MTSLEIYSKITQRQKELRISDAELREIAHLSPKQWRARVSDPGKFRLNELVAVCNYLGLRLEIVKANR